MPLLHQLRSQLRRLSPPATPPFKDGYIFPLDKDYAALEACGLVAGLAAAMASLTTGDPPVQAAVTGFVAGCSTGLLAVYIMRLEMEMGPFADLMDDVP